MNAISLENAKRDLDAVLAQVLSSAEPVVLNTGAGGSVVLMPLEDFSSWQETAYLLKNPANAAHLRKSIAEAERGQLAAHELDEK